MRNREGKFSCVDEDGCDEEAFNLCAQASMATGVVAVDFLECMDSSKEKTPDAKAKACATATSLPWADIQSCQSGSKGAELQKEAAAYFSKRFPGAVGVPRIELNGKEHKGRDYKSLLSDLCATGIKAKACSSLDTVLV
eukprot:TRINITY_DN83960_c0_g1_i1.p1 TRINITY_DN83960_c0_g1~~TRINITY_DN83960_c0_g1_i1.p1  ORF type:complete len:139 (+),score=45.77 TRINITY_DN83960_c0_g1_i1:266-682(+)